ncbi:class I SAM-dependent methyltransferase [Saccharopolyspora sp. NPDC003752]
MNQETSRTALLAAAARAAHVLVDAEPHIFADPLAVPLLGEQAEELLGYHRFSGEHPILRGARAQAVIRCRYTEERLAAATRNGIAQYVILGAGLDTFAYRNELGVRVFEVDHPVTQHWKRDLLENAGITIPGPASHVAVDFESDSLGDALVAAGFDPARPAFISWLGVTMYLTRDSIHETLATIGRFASGTQLVTDYVVSEELRDAVGREYAEAVAQVAGEGGEPWLSYFTPDEMAALLRDCGLTAVDDVDQRNAIDPELWHRRDGLSPSTLSRLVHARTE